jgi:signal transduction histidine kinase
VAHELRTPLTIILGHVQLLQRTPQDTPTALHQRLQIINRQSSQLAVLITDLLDLARIETDHMHRRLMPLDYALLVRSITEEMRLLHRTTPSTSRSRTTAGLWAMRSAFGRS